MRLIDADALKHVLCDECEYSKTLCVEKADCDTVYAIDAQPTIEAVPVVRCKDCRYFGNKVRIHDTYVCNKLGVYMPADGYCSDGKAK